MHSRRLYACLVAAVLAVASVAALIASDSLNIRLRDDCDPATFNAAVRPGTCVGEGDTTFDDFLAEFQETGRVEKWRFNNDHAGVDRGTVIGLTNRGGETHTFTKVAEFGGGIIPVLNTRLAPSELPFAPECGTPGVGGAPGQLAPPTDANLIVPAGGSGETGHLTKRGTVRFQCCIHPWMRAEVTVK